METHLELLELVYNDERAKEEDDPGHEDVWYEMTAWSLVAKDDGFTELQLKEMGFATSQF